jgi:predicted permease
MLIAFPKELMQSIRDNSYQAWRSWTASFKRGGSTLPVILTLAFAIGSTTAMFVLIKGVLTVLPFEHPEQLALVWEARDPGPKELRLSIPDYLDFVAQNRSFARLAVLAPKASNLRVNDGVERVSSPVVGTGFFTVLGVHMLKGREPNDQDVSTVLLSENLWRSHFPGWDDPIGKTVQVDGIDRKVIGIVPRGQEFPQTAKMWVPFSTTVDCACKRNGHSYQVIGRLRTGVSAAQADAEVKTIAARLAAQYPDSNAHITAWVRPLAEHLTGDVKSSIWMLLVATCSLLLMACTSIAAILFAQGAFRAPEIAMRQLLGGSRKRIIVQLLIESCFSAVVASGFGLLFAWWITQLFLRIIPKSLPHINALSIDLWAAGFALGLSLCTVFIFSLVPAIYTTRVHRGSYMLGGALPGALGRSQKIRNGLIVVENTIAFGLLVISLLLLNSLMHLTNVDPGFTQQGLVSADLSPSPARYSSVQQTTSFFSSLLEHVSALPQVESAAIVDSLPMTGSTEGTHYYPIGNFDKRPGEEPSARVSYVSPGYFKTMKIPLLRGRDFSSADGEHSHVVVISEGIARDNWPDEDPIGKKIGRRGAGNLTWEVIGIVPDIKDDGLASISPRRLYLNEQEFGERDMTLVVRSSGNVNTTLASLRHEVNALDSMVPVYNLKTVEEILNSSIERNEIVTRIIGAFSVMALMLAAVGVYGVVLSNLVRRTREFGIRIAVGSSFGHIAWLVFREGFLLVFTGMGGGLVVAFIASRSLGNFLYGVERIDIPSYSVAAGAQLLVVALGCLALLRRISKLDPVNALKNG